MIEAICAWCKCSLGTRNWADEGVTHGICQECKTLELKKEGLLKGEVPCITKTTKA